MQFSGTRDEKGEIKLSAKPALNPKEHQFIKFDKEAPSHRALLGASANTEHPNYVEGLAIHSGGLFSVPKTATRKPGKADKLNVDQERSAKRKDTSEAIAKRNAQIKKARG